MSRCDKCGQEGTFDRASQLIDALKSGSYDPAEWDVPF